MEFSKNVEFKGSLGFYSLIDLSVRMQLNAIGLVVVVFLMNLIQSVGFDFVTAGCLILLNDNANSRSALKQPLVRKNPLVTFSEKTIQEWFSLHESRHTLVIAGIKLATNNAHCKSSCI